MRKINFVVYYTSDNKQIKHTRFFDTDKAKKICDIKNDFGNAVKEIYITQKGVIFFNSIYKKNLEVADQEAAKKWIGE